MLRRPCLLEINALKEGVVRVLFMEKRFADGRKLAWDGAGALEFCASVSSHPRLHSTLVWSGLLRRDPLSKTSGR